MVVSQLTWMHILNKKQQFATFDKSRQSYLYNTITITITITIRPNRHILAQNLHPLASKTFPSHAGEVRHNCVSSHALPSSSVHGCFLVRLPYRSLKRKGKVYWSAWDFLLEENFDDFFLQELVCAKHSFEPSSMHQITTSSLNAYHSQDGMNFFHNESFLKLDFANRKHPHS